MDFPTLLTFATSYAAAVLFNKCTETAIIEAAKKLLPVAHVFRGGSQLANSELSPSPAELQKDSVLQELEGLLNVSGALRRAQLLAPYLRGAKLLWVDDAPENNRNEQDMFTALGIGTINANSTDVAMGLLSSNPRMFDLLISDIARETRDAGLRMLSQMRAAGHGHRVVFYIDTVSPELGLPATAFGIADEPEELLHLILDALERTRI
jgi:CheY-like chemotaxis protein